MQKRAAESRRSQPMRTVTQPGSAVAKTGSSLTSSPAKNATRAGDQTKEPDVFGIGTPAEIA